MMIPRCNFLFILQQHVEMFLAGIGRELIASRCCQMLVHLLLNSRSWRDEAVQSFEVMKSTLPSGPTGSGSQLFLF